MSLSGRCSRTVPIAHGKVHEPTPILPNLAEFACSFAPTGCKLGGLFIPLCKPYWPFEDMPLPKQVSGRKVKACETWKSPQRPRRRRIEVKGVPISRDGSSTSDV